MHTHCVIRALIGEVREVNRFVLIRARDREEHHDENSRQLIVGTGQFSLAINKKIVI